MRDDLLLIKLATECVELASRTVGRPEFPERPPVDATPHGDLPAKRAVEWLRVLADTWVNADVREAKADLLHAIYDRIVVKGRSIVAARLTPAAYANGLAFALPQVVRARPEGFEPPTL